MNKPFAAFVAVYFLTLIPVAAYGNPQTRTLNKTDLQKDSRLEDSILQCSSIWNVFIHRRGNSSINLEDIKQKIHALVQAGKIPVDQEASILEKQDLLAADAIKPSVDRTEVSCIWDNVKLQALTKQEFLTSHGKDLLKPVSRRSFYIDRYCIVQDDILKPQSGASSKESKLQFTLIQPTETIQGHTDLFNTSADRIVFCREPLYKLFADKGPIFQSDTEVGVLFVANPTVGKEIYHDGIELLLSKSTGKPIQIYLLDGLKRRYLKYSYVWGNRQDNFPESITKSFLDINGVPINFVEWNIVSASFDSAQLGELSSFLHAGLNVDDARFGIDKTVKYQLTSGAMLDDSRIERFILEQKQSQNVNEPIEQKRRPFVLIGVLIAIGLASILIAIKLVYYSKPS